MHNWKPPRVIVSPPAPDVPSIKLWFENVMCGSEPGNRSVEGMKALKSSVVAAAALGAARWNTCKSKAIGGFLIDHQRTKWTKGKEFAFSDFWFGITVTRVWSFESYSASEGGKGFIRLNFHQILKYKCNKQTNEHENQSSEWIDSPGRQVWSTSSANRDWHKVTWKMWNRMKCSIVKKCKDR